MGVEDAIGALLDAQFELHTLAAPTPDCKFAHFSRFVQRGQHGHISPTQYAALFRDMAFVVGTGSPTLSPTPLEALAQGAAFLNPLVHGSLESEDGHYQHQHLAQTTGPPYSYKYDRRAPKTLVAAAEAAVRNRFASHVPFSNRPEATTAAACAMLADELGSMCRPHNDTAKSPRHHHKRSHIPSCANASECGVCNRSLALAMRSNCPSERWLDRISPSIAAPNMLILNVGANKGYNVNSFLARFQRGWNTTNADWCRGHCDCGMCGACSSKASFVYGRANVSAIAIEMMRANYENLKGLFVKFKVPGEVIHAAGGEEAGTAYEPAADLKIGHEQAGIQSHGISVAMVTVDQIVTERKVKTIDLLSIDTEGHDATVLRGASKTLERRLAKVVEFEYHGIGAGSGEKLDDTISMMRRFGYSCFWQSNGGEISPFFRECAASYEFHAWSNVVCATGAKIVTALRTLVPTDLQA